MEEATFLAKYGSTVYIVHRRDELRASKIMQQRALDNPKIEMLWSHVVTQAKGADFLEAVRVKDLKTDEQRDIPVAGLFFAIGHTPNTSFLNGQIDTDEQGYIVTKPDSTQTNIPGVFACGDAVTGPATVVEAIGGGKKAAEAIHRYLTGLPQATMPPRWINALI